MELTPENEALIQQKLEERRAARMGGKAKPAPVPKEEEDPNAPMEHYLTPTLEKLAAMRENVWLTGPAGSGKSKAIELVATKLDVRFACPPIGRETTVAQLMGYFNAQGNYVRTPLREVIEHGGLIHFEELDFAGPATGTAINAVLANDIIGFPDGAVRRHADSMIFASANTFGTGANATYIGSQGLNAATLDRFIFIDFPYDEKLELRIAPNREWTKHVQITRRKVAKLGLRHVVSPRASIKGGKMIEAGFTVAEVEKMVLFKGLDKHTIEKIKLTPSTND